MDYSNNIVIVFTSIIAIALWLFLCSVAGGIADRKGLWGWGYVITAFLFSPLIGILLALVAEENIVKIESKKIASGVYKRCPSCVELVRNEAKVCRYCNYSFTKNVGDTQ